MVGLKDQASTIAGAESFAVNAEDEDVHALLTAGVLRKNADGKIEFPFGAGIGGAILPLGETGEFLRSDDCFSAGDTTASEKNR